MRTQSSHMCIYCQLRKAETKDHVPPKLISPKPRPNNLVTVPACQQCNQSFSMDDEYFRIYLSVREAGEEHKDHKLLLEKSIRSIKEGSKFSQYWKSRLRVIDKLRNDGTKGYVMQFQPDDTRLERIGERIIRGLFHHHFEKPLQTGGIFQVWFDHGFEAVNKSRHFTKVSMMLKDSQVFHVGTVFCYQFEVAKEDDAITIWRLVFLDKIWCTVITNFDSIEG